MKMSLAAFVCFSFSVIFAQDNTAIVGEWHVLSVDDGGVYWNTKNDSASISEKVKKTYEKSAVGLQDRVGYTRGTYSHSRFIFEIDGTFREYYSTIENTLLFSGTYTVDSSKGKIFVNVKNRLGHRFDKEMEYKIEGEKLLLNKDNRPDNRIKFVLEKVNR
jgi:hypothetical protein